MRLRILIIMILFLCSSIAGMAMAGIKGHDETPDIKEIKRQISSDASLLKCVKLIFRRKYMEAIRCLYLPISESPTSEALFYFGKSFLCMGEYEKAVEILETGLEFSRKEWYKNLERFFLAEIGLCYYKLGEERKGIRYLDKAIELNNDIAGYNKILIYSNLGRQDEAVEAFIRFMIRFPESTEMEKAREIIFGFD